ncbi:acetyl-CoA carboxylase biotin carboxyl carrier protein [Clostridiisalibacter paucivorans]|uniref:acetyl-CoA carboxylase biotin carboxyl carrier protein n=1 Tax=Clostridiisalibacter paucivorans TaxID=408753 RepID=UPI0004794588|nr:acetyl-CoA carboxylase biotin carboxyl carrier protein [Clostridiisalibacter paucivorans]
MDFKDLRELILTVDKTSIKQVNIEMDDIKINIFKEKEDYKNKENVESETKTVKEKTDKEINEKEMEDLYIVKSPIVGTFYAASSPEDDPFVKIGHQVSKGDTLCIIEAMKMMNEIQSEINGEIVEVLVENEDVVEYGQPLMKIRG